MDEQAFIAAGVDRKSDLLQELSGRRFMVQLAACSDGNVREKRVLTSRLFARMLRKKLWVVEYGCKRLFSRLKWTFQSLTPCNVIQYHPKPYHIVMGLTTRARDAA